MFQYNQKKVCSQFKEEKAFCVDNTSTDNKSITLIGDYKISCLNNKRKQKHGTLNIPYDLLMMNSRITNRKPPERCSSQFNFIINDSGLGRRLS